MRESEEKKSSLYKTTCTGLVIASLAIFLGVIFSARNFVSSLENNPIWPYLALCLPLGIIYVAIGVLGMVFFSLENRTYSKRALFIIGLISGIIFILSSIPVFLVLKDIAIGICAVGIGICLIFISFLERA